MSADDQSFRHSPEVSWRRVGETLILLDFRTSDYYTLDESGAWIWERLAQGGAIDAIASELAEQYAVEASAARSDVASFIRALEDARLLVRGR